MVIQNLFTGLYTLLQDFYGILPNTDNYTRLFWVNGFAMFGTLVAIAIPFYVVYRVVKWLI